MTDLKTAGHQGGWQCLAICFTHMGIRNEMRHFCSKWQDYHALGECLRPLAFEEWIWYFHNLLTENLSSWLQVLVCN